MRRNKFALVEIEAPTREDKHAQPVGIVRPSRLPPFGAAQHRLDAGQEFARVERLRHIIVGAHLKAHDTVGLLAHGRQHDDWNFRVRPQPAAEREPILSRQHEIEDDQVDGPIVERLAHAAPIGDGADAQPVLAQVSSHEIANFAVVIDDKDVRLLRHGRNYMWRIGGETSLLVTECYWEGR